MTWAIQAAFLAVVVFCCNEVDGIEVCVGKPAEGASSSCTQYNASDCPFRYWQRAETAVQCGVSGLNCLALGPVCASPGDGTTGPTETVCVHDGPPNNVFNMVDGMCESGVDTNINNSVVPAAWSWVMTGTSNGKVTKCNLYNGQTVISNIQSGTSAKAFDNKVDNWAAGMWWEGGSQSNFRYMLVLPQAATIENVTIYMVGGGGGGKCMSCNAMTIYTWDGSDMVETKPSTSCNMNSRASEVYKRTFVLGQPVTTTIIGLEFTLFWCGRNAFMLQEVTFGGTEGWPNPPETISVTVTDRGTA